MIINKLKKHENLFKFCFQVQLGIRQPTDRKIKNRQVGCKFLFLPTDFPCWKFFNKFQ